jgi:enamine deaminase RidA (YjgF/YER057c/UK114 family)
MFMHIEAKLAALGLQLPESKYPTDVRLPFARVRIRGNRAYISGHGPLNPDGSVAGGSGKVGAEISVEEGYQAARSVALAILASLKQELGDLDRVAAWLKVHGMVNAAPNFTKHPAVINGFSDFILELYGPEAGAHARSAVGMGSLPFGMAVEIEAEVEISS